MKLVAADIGGTHARFALAEIDAGLDALTALRDTPAGSIRINAADHSLRTVIWPRLGPFLKRYPDIRVDTISITYEYNFEKEYRWSEYFGRGAEVRSYLEHVAEKNGVTTQTMTIRYESKAVRDAALKTGMTDGMEQSFKKLDELLAAA